MKNDKAPLIVFGIFITIQIFLFFTFRLPLLNYIFFYLAILSFFAFLPLLIIGAILSIFEKGAKVGIYLLLVGFFFLGILIIAMFISVLGNATFYEIFLRKL